MTAAELIKLLQEIPPDAKVMINSFDGESCAWIDAYEGGGEVMQQLLNNETEGWWAKR